MMPSGCRLSKEALPDHMLRLSLESTYTNALHQERHVPNTSSPPTLRLKNTKQYFHKEPKLGPISTKKLLNGLNKIPTPNIPLPHTLRPSR